MFFQEYFGDSPKVPEIEGMLWLKTEGKKAWKKFFCVLRASGLYYNPNKGKGKVRIHRFILILILSHTVRYSIYNINCSGQLLRMDIP